MGDVGSRIAGILRVRRAEQAVEDAVRFERSIDARSARRASGFWVGPLVR